MSGSRVWPSTGIAGVLATFIVGLATAGNWGSTAVTQDEGSVPCNCTSIPGFVGGLEAFQTQPVRDGPASGGQSTVMKVGALWVGSRLETCSGVKQARDNWIQHKNQRSTAGGPATNPILLVSTASRITTSGHAEQLDPADPSWWWDSEAFVQEKTIEVRVLINGQWMTYTPMNAPTYAVGSARDAPGNVPQTPQPPTKPKPWTQMSAWNDPNNEADDHPQTDGAWLEAVLLTAELNATACTVKCSTTSTGGPTSGDNVDVKSVRHELRVQLTTWFVSP